MNPIKQENKDKEKENLSSGADIFKVNPLIK
jgi:hypothetical protein